MAKPFTLTGYPQTETTQPEQRASTYVEPEKWLPALLLGWYFFNSWSPPWVWYSGTRWYLVLSLALLTFLIQARRLDMRAAKVFWGIQGPALIGAILALLRAPEFDEAAVGMVRMWVAFITMLLFLTTFASRRGRTVLLIALITVAIMWTIEIQLRLATLGEFLPSTFAGEEDNKNRISLCLAMAATALLAFSLLWKPAPGYPRIKAKIIRLVVLGLSGFMYFTQSLTYSRSELFAALIGFLAVIMIASLQTRGMQRLFRVGLWLFVVSIIVVIITPFVLDAAPYWGRLIEPILNPNDPNSFVARRMLIQKGLIIIGDNPFIGIGAEATKPAYTYAAGYAPRGLIHNEYLTLWAELGLPGLISACLLVGIYLRLLRHTFFQAPLVDKIWLLLFIPYLFALNFINVATLSMVAILAGIYYEAYIKSHPSERLSILFK